MHACKSVNKIHKNSCFFKLGCFYFGNCMTSDLSFHTCNIVYHIYLSENHTACCSQTSCGYFQLLIANRLWQIWCWDFSFLDFNSFLFEARALVISFWSSESVRSSERYPLTISQPPASRSANPTSFWRFKRFYLVLTLWKPPRVCFLWSPFLHFQCWKKLLGCSKIDFCFMYVNIFSSSRNAFCQRFYSRGWCLLYDALFVLCHHVYHNLCKVACYLISIGLLQIAYFIVWHLYGRNNWVFVNLVEYRRTETEVTRHSFLYLHVISCHNCQESNYAITVQSL